MSSIRKRGKSYQITVCNGYDNFGKKIIRTQTFLPDTSLTPKQQEKQVKDFANEFERSVKNKTFLQGNKITLAKFASLWEDNYAKRDLEATTYCKYKPDLDLKILPALGHIKLSELSPLHIESLYNNLREDGVRLDGKPGGYSINTIRHCHAVLSSILSCAVRWNYVQSNPCSIAKLPKDNTKTDCTNFFTIEQSKLFLRALNLPYSYKYTSHTRNNVNGTLYHVNEYSETKSLATQFKVLFNIGLNGGLRRGELLALTWDDINLETGMLAINKSRATLNSESVIKPTKNVSSNRTIKLADEVITLISAYKEEQNQYRLSIGDQWQDNNLLFTQWNGKPMYKDTPNKALKKIITRYNDTVDDEKLKLPFITVHGLRHTCATLLIACDVDINTVAARLGHKKPSTTSETYIHPLNMLDKKAANPYIQRLATRLSY